MTVKNLMKFTLQAFRPHLLKSQGFRPHLLQCQAFRPHLLQSLAFRPRLLQSQAFRPHLLLSQAFRPHLLQSRFLCTTGVMQSKLDGWVGADVDIVKSIYQSALRAVEPMQMVKNNLSLRDGNMLYVGSGGSQRQFALNGKRCYVVAFGKAVIGMVTTVERILGDRIVSGIASVPTNIQQELAANGRSDLIPSTRSRVELCEGAFMNLPDVLCMRTSQRIQDLVIGLSEEDILITLTSGGGSALLCLPVPPLSLEDVAETTQSLAKAGANIIELNTVRKHLELLKGGGLARFARPAQVINLILSDIVGDPLDCIASGPTIVDASRAGDALAIIEKYLHNHQIRSAVVNVLQGNSKEKYLPGMDGECVDKPPHNIIIGSNSIALQAAVEECHSQSVIPVILTSALCGNAAQVGKDVVELARRILVSQGDTDYLDGLFRDVSDLDINIGSRIQLAIAQARTTRSPMCVMFGGETTVQVTGSGKGGRNQEMCLSALAAFHSLSVPDSRLVFASIGTDGQDGPTDAAGAIVTPHCLLGNELSPSSYLANNDSYSYFTILSGGRSLIRTGLTGTNVMDLGILLLNLHAHTSSVDVSKNWSNVIQS